MYAAQDEGIRCAAMKVVMLSPLPLERIAAFLADCKELLVPELNYEGQFANLITGALGRPVTRLTRATGAPMDVDEILQAVRSLASARTAA
jgi:2-oxoglutarate ferredoxin oxidoreductase subunit alpha